MKNLFEKFGTVVACLLLFLFGAAVAIIPGYLVSFPIALVLSFMGKELSRGQELLLIIAVSIVTGVSFVLAGMDEGSTSSSSGGSSSSKSTERYEDTSAEEYVDCSGRWRKPGEPFVDYSGSWRNSK